MSPVVENLGKVSITSEDYSVGKNYDVNTIVSDMEIGMACISKCPVPAGIPLTDKRFWLPISKLPEEIMINYHNLEHRVAELEAKMQIVMSTLGITI